MWALIFKAAVAFAQTKWARDNAKIVISKLRAKHDAKIKAIADGAGIAVPHQDGSSFRAATVIRTKTECFKPGMFVFVEGVTYRISKLLSVSSAEVTYEAEPV